MPDFSFSRTITQIPIAGTAGSQDLVAAPGAGLKIFVVGFLVELETTGTLKFTEGTGPTDLTGTLDITADTPFSVFGSGFPILQTNTANAKLSLVTATGAPRGWLRYFVSP